MSDAPTTNEDKAVKRVSSNPKAGQKCLVDGCERARNKLTAKRYSSFCEYHRKRGGVEERKAWVRANHPNSTRYADIAKQHQNNGESTPPLERI